LERRSSRLSRIRDTPLEKPRRFTEDAAAVLTERPLATMKRFVSLSLCLIAVLATATLPAAHAEDKPKKVKYVAPEGFAGHKWGDLLSTFDRLPQEPIGVGAAWMRSIEKQTDFHCVPISAPGPTMSGAVEGCDFQATLLRLRTDFEGGGIYVLSEYAVKDQGFRFGDEADGVVLHPVVYQFCANWGGSRKKHDVPQNFDSKNKFCGMRFVFESETREQLRKLPGEYVTNYDRMLDKLILKYGRPNEFLRRGRVVIETLEGDSSDVADRKFSIWRWCPATDNGFHTDCKASVVLSLDPATGEGTVLYSTPLLWEYAYARENYGFKGDRLYKMLHASK
jgi:hypothetical protein